jgi:release factor glutamine methyltransferase
MKDRDAGVARLRAAGCVFPEHEIDAILATAEDDSQIQSMIGRREGGEPLEHVLGWVEFCGLRIALAPGVFVPRVRTEFLAQTAIDALRNVNGSACAVDMCCGSGTLAVAIANALPDVVLHAADIDDDCCACARGNLHGVGVVHCGDLFAALPLDLHGTIDVICANVPYVPSKELATMPAEARDHERAVALDGGADGLEIAGRVMREAGAWLRRGGSAMIEVAPAQVDALCGIAAHSGLTPRVLTSDEYEATVVVACA